MLMEVERGEKYFGGRALVAAVLRRDELWQPNGAVAKISTCAAPHVPPVPRPLPGQYNTSSARGRKGSSPTLLPSTGKPLLTRLL